MSPASQILNRGFSNLRHLIGFLMVALCLSFVGTSTANAQVCGLDPAFSKSVNPLPELTEIRDLTLGDYDGDGNIDMHIVAQPDRGTITDEIEEGIALGKGDGTFYNPLMRKFPPVFRPIVERFSGDFNGDGFDDLAETRTRNDGGGLAYIRVRYASGETMFGQTFFGSESEIVVQPSSLGSTIDAAAGDFDRDGDADIVNLTRGDFRLGEPPILGLSVRRANPDGSFEPEERISFPIDPFNLARLHMYTADVNGDGRADPIILDDGASEIHIFLTDADGNPSSTPETISYSADKKAEQEGFLRFNDMNNDGALDIVAFSTGFSIPTQPEDVAGFTILRGNGDGTFQPETEPELYPDFVSTVFDDFPMAFADLTGDSIGDFFLGEFFATSGGMFSVRRGTPDLTFEEEQMYGLREGYDAVGALDELVTADFNNDGLTDVIIADSRRRFFDGTGMYLFLNKCGERRCPADFNDDEVVNADDSLAFETVFDLGEKGADIDVDGKVDLNDRFRFTREIDRACTKFN